MKRLLVLAGIVLVLITTTNNVQAARPAGACSAPIIVSN
jgi:hypothetical protein